MGFRVASSHAGSSVQVYLDDDTTPVATVSIPNTGDWPVFQTVPVPVTLPAGQHRLSLLFPTDYVNINWISFGRNGGVYPFFWLSVPIVRIPETFIVFTATSSFGWQRDGSRMMDHVFEFSKPFN